MERAERNVLHMLKVCRRSAEKARNMARFLWNHVEVIESSMFGTVSRYHSLGRVLGTIFSKDFN